MRHTNDSVQIELAHQLFLIATFALSVPNRKPSGRMTAALPFCFRRYIMTDMNRSAVSLLARSDGNDS